MSRMQFQYDFTGGSTPTNLGLLVCPTCLDDLAFQLKLLVLPPDPKPVFNTRPENYVVDETNWITTEDEDIITTEGGSLFTPSIPNPDDDANTVNLAAAISYPGGSITTLYLDLFDGDPTSGGSSVLLTLTGSATRTNIASYMATNTSDQAVNTTIVPVTSSSLAVTNVNYVAFYTASSGGTLLVSGALSASPTVSEGMVVQFDQLALVIQL